MPFWNQRLLKHVRHLTHTHLASVMQSSLTPQMDRQHLWWNVSHWLLLPFFFPNSLWYLIAVQVAQVWIIFQPIYHPACTQSSLLVYVQTFTFAGWRNQDGVLLEEPNVDMYLLKWHFCSAPSHAHEQVWMGDVILLTDILYPVDIIPVFGQNRDCHINSSNALEICNSFYLNNFSSKDLYHMLLSDFA